MKAGDTYRIRIGLQDTNRIIDVYKIKLAKVEKKEVFFILDGQVKQMTKRDFKKIIH